MEADRVCICLRILLCPLDCPLKWRLEDEYLEVNIGSVKAVRDWRIEHEYLEVNMEGDRVNIRLPILICPLDCPFKWRLEDAS